MPALLLGTGGCVADRAARAEVVVLRRQVDSLRTQGSRAERTIRQLENRVFVLEDKLETVRIAQERTPDVTPKLPVVRREPPRAAAVDTGEYPPAGEAVLYPSDDVEVVYEGAAAQPGRKRPVIRLYEGDGPGDLEPVDEPPRGRRRTPARAEAGVLGVDPARVEDRIPVAPLPGKGAPSPSSPLPDDGDPVSAYRDAHAALMRHDHAAAITGFTRFLERWPDHDYADNSQYWMGEAHYDRKDYATALVEFRNVVKRYPSGNKAPDALLKIGYCHLKLGDSAAARDVLAQVVEIYPRTEAARLAAKRLTEMGE